MLISRNSPYAGDLCKVDSCLNFGVSNHTSGILVEWVNALYRNIDQLSIIFWSAKGRSNLWTQVKANFSTKAPVTGVMHVNMTDTLVMQALLVLQA